MQSTFVHISPTLLTVLEQHIVVTPNERLAREYRSAYDQAQATSGVQAWPTLNCMSLRQLLVREFTEQKDRLSGQSTAALSDSRARRCRTPDTHCVASLGIGAPLQHRPSSPINEFWSLQAIH
jgi:hypothetical protein